MSGKLSKLVGGVGNASTLRVIELKGIFHVSALRWKNNVKSMEFKL